MGTIQSVHLYLVRHGLTEWNREGRYYGHTDVPCLPEEWHLFDGLRSQLAALSFSRVYCSDLTRCRQTLHDLNPELAKIASYDHRLREYHFGVWEGRTHQELEHDPLYQAWLRNLETTAPPGGESMGQFRQRVSEWLREVLRPENLPARILTMTHGGVIRYLLYTWGVRASMWQSPINMGQAYVLELTRTERGWACTASWEVPSQGSALLSGHKQQVNS
ncbi:alpha-ribazole phosphatase [Caldalkalibacillus uzonensis]|uniref:Alpha-ribazole phosphatase n=1 Tax=Caldalkalibacillus uzonensis TaxID=353224 RepID=A0ABU0CPL0_9BACI|nr:histidine phosphatase family protein [Caldalkalibacillus uzonensis]MDQ0338336.1 alpha-ribazole phosphatase [Caldalkalibacillus uzonensis]